MKNDKICLRQSGGLYRNLNISVQLLDALIVGGLAVTAFIIIASASLG